MAVESCIPVIPSSDLQKSLRFWVDGLQFSIVSEMRKGEKLVNCVLRSDSIYIMLNRRSGTTAKPENYNGIHLYWAPANINETRERLQNLGFSVSEIVNRPYGQTEFTLTDDDGFFHCFGVATAA